jgi:hypothetical protein
MTQGPVNTPQLGGETTRFCKTCEHRYRHLDLERVMDDFCRLEDYKTKPDPVTGKTKTRRVKCRVVNSNAICRNWKEAPESPSLRARITELVGKVYG